MTLIGWSVLGWDWRTWLQKLVRFFHGAAYSITMQHGRCWEKYLKSSGVAPGQLVSSSSSRS